MNELIYWTVTSIAIIGVWLNIKKDNRCFKIWAATNAIFAVETFLSGLYNMTFLFSIYTGLAIYGSYSWGKNN